jgi:hypothetical protein
MGLDISAYRNVTRVGDSDGGDAPADCVRLYHNPDFAGRSDDVPAGIYRADDEMNFRAGSYGGYNRWREQLCALAGHGTPRDVWDAENPQGPFIELINFSDCEGTIGTGVSAKLARDFAEYQANADAHPDEWFRDRYAKWRAAFEMAAQHGAVEFH